MRVRTLLWDIEATHLKADWGTVLCVGFKPYGAGKAEVLSITDKRGWKPTQDRDLIAQVRDRLADADLWVTYYGTLFDVPYIQAKCLEYGIRPLPQTAHLDLYYAAKKHLCISRRRLDTVSRFLSTEAKKTPVDGETWKRAQAGDADAIKYVIAHCRADVLVLEQVYTRLFPVVHRYGRCSTCASPRLLSHGMRPCEGKPCRRLWCQSCGLLQWQT